MCRFHEDIARYAAGFTCLLIVVIGRLRCAFRFAIPAFQNRFKKHVAWDTKTESAVTPSRRWQPSYDIKHERSQQTCSTWGQEGNIHMHYVNIMRYHPIMQKPRWSLASRVATTNQRPPSAGSDACPSHTFCLSRFDADSQCTAAVTTLG